MHFSKEEVNQDGERPKHQVIEPRYHGCFRWLWSRHGWLCTRPQAFSEDLWPVSRFEVEEKRAVEVSRKISKSGEVEVHNVGKLLRERCWDL